MNLMNANRQWANRPADERFQSVQELHNAVTKHRETAAQAVVSTDLLRVEVIDGDVKLLGKTGTPANLTHWSMGQICQQAAAPAGYIRNLPATLAAQNVNHGLKSNGHPFDKTALLFGTNNGSLVLRGAVSEIYKRIWNNDVTARLLKLQQENPSWTNPLAYDIHKQANRPDGMIPAGLYASDHDMFAFLVDESKRINGSPEGLNRGFFTWNSEVGGSSFGFMGFLYDRVCGNNIVWGAKDVFSLRIRHVGQADDKAFRELAVQLTKYSESESGKVEKMIQKARAMELGSTTDEILDTVFGIAQKVGAKELTKTRITEALQTAEKRTERYGNPNTLWAVVGGLTENSQTLEHADKRLEVDKAAGKLLNVIEF